MVYCLILWADVLLGKPTAFTATVEFSFPLTFAALSVGPYTLGLYRTPNFPTLPELQVALIAIWWKYKDFWERKLDHFSSQHKIAELLG